MVDDTELVSKSAENRPTERPKESVSSVVFSTFEQALRVVGPLGKYQLGFAIMQQAFILILTGNYTLLAYSTFKPFVSCIDENGTVLAVLERDENKNRTFCTKRGQGLCHSLEWDAPFHTIIEEWELICELDYVPNMISSLQTSGSLIAVFSGYLSDKYGRRRVFNILFWMFSGAMLMGALAQSPLIFVISRIFIGTLLGATLNILFVWSMEQTDQRNSVFLNIFSHWHLAYMITAVMAYFAGGWRKYLWCLWGIAWPLMAVFYWFMESPRWVIQERSLEEAAELLNRLGSYNRRHKVVITKENLRGISIQQHDKDIIGAFKMLLTNRRFLKYLAVVGLMVYATGSSASTFIFEMTRLGGSPFVRFFIFGGLRLMLMPFIYFLDKKFFCWGRRQMCLIPCTVILLCYIVASIFAVFKPMDLGEQSIELFIAILIAAVTCNFLWVGIGLYQIELFPTSLRNNAANIIGGADVVSGVLSPLWIQLESRVAGLPFVITTLVLLITIPTAYLVLPETKGKQIPDTIKDVMRIEDDPNMKKSWSDRDLNCCGEETTLLGDMEGEGDEEGEYIEHTENENEDRLS